MSSRPIVLFKPKVTLTSDDACTTIIEYKLPPPPSAVKAPYQRHHEITSGNTLSYVPPLAYFCIKSLVEYFDQLHALGPTRLQYEPPHDGHDFDILQALIPLYRPFSQNHSDFNLRQVDPRLWAVLAQIYTELPPEFRLYELPLADQYLPLLQTIPSTEHFSLITVLSLPKCRDLTDDTVVELRHLHTLTAFDASVTALGSWGIRTLAKSLAWSEGDEERSPERRGLWGLRVLFLRDCINVDDKVFESLLQFPLLSVVDLRGTTCQPWKLKNFPFQPSSDTTLYNSTSLPKVLSRLSSYTSLPRTMFSHPHPYVVKVDSLHHKPDNTPSYRLPTGVGTTGDGSSTQEESKVVNGRTDVFLPYDARPAEVDPKTHDESESNTWMDEVAVQENILYMNQRAVKRVSGLLYLPPPRVSDLSSRIPPRFHTAESRKAQRLMLFRTPPPWSVLPSSPPAPSKPRTSRSSVPGMPSSVFSEVGLQSHKPSSRGLKRKVSAEDVAPSDQARKRLHALSSIQGMIGLVQKRAKPPSSGTSTSSRAGVASSRPARGTANANPFVRKATENVSRGAGMHLKTKPLVMVPVTGDGPTYARKSAERNPVNQSHRPSRNAAPPPVAAKVQRVTKRSPPTANANIPTQSTKTTTKRPRSPTPPPHDPIRKKNTPAKPKGMANPPTLAPSNTSTSTSAAAADSPRPAKKLRPISELPVPPWPKQPHLKPLSARMPNLSALSKFAPKAQKQTTLKATVSRPAGASRRRVSAPEPTVSASSSEPQIAKDEAVSGGTKKSRPPSGSSKEKGSRRASGGGDGFDWKGWSAG